MFNDVFRMPPDPRGDAEVQLADLREWLRILSRQLNAAGDEINANAGTITPEEENAPTAANKHTVSVVQKSGSASTAHNAATAAGSITLKKGIYLLEASVVFAANNLGYRILNCTSASGAVSRGPHSSNVEFPRDAITLPMNVVQVVELQQETTYYCNVFQNSGATLSVTWSLKATKLN